MRSSSNPAFRNLPGGQGGGYATFDRRGGGMMGGGAALGGMASKQADIGRADPGERPLTMDDVVQKTGITVAVAILAGAFTAFSGFWGLALPAFIVGIIVAFVLIFKPHLAKAPLVLTYSVCMGVALGGITAPLNAIYPGIGVQAIVGTAGVLVGMLIVYKTGAVRVTPKFTKWLMGAMIGVVALIIFNLVMSLFGVNTGLRDGGPLAIGFSLLVIGVAAFSLLLDFDMADRAIKDGAPEKMSWYIAFGLMTTLVWLYIEILRLLSYLRGE